MPAGTKLERDLLVSAREELTALEARLTWMIGAELDDLLLGARLANQGHWAKAQQSLLEQGLMAPGARLKSWNDHSATILWSEQCSSLKGIGTRLYRVRSEPCFYLRFVWARLNYPGRWSKAL